MQSTLAMVNGFVAALLEQIETLDSQILDELAKRDTQISIRDTELSNLRATTVELGSQLESAKIREINLQARITDLEEINAEQVEEIRILRLRPPVDPPPPPIEVSPDITISLDGLGSFRPPLRGDRQGNEIRYRGTLNNEIDIVLDCKDDGQIAVVIERCWVDLPSTAPTIETILTVSLGAELQHEGVAGKASITRLGHHCGPRMVLNPSNPPKVDLPALVSAGLVPNYLNASFPLDKDLEKIWLGAYPWNSSPANSFALGEDYGQVINSWSGGAGPLLNEAAHLMPVQVVYLLTQDPRAWGEVVRLANSSGNYAIHYKLRDNSGGRYPNPSETGSLPFLQGPALVTLKSASGNNLPIPEPAHEHSLTYLAYLLTGERYYREELEAWCTYNLLTRPKNDLRLQGNIWSGQIRAAAWSLRALLHAYLAFGETPFIYDRAESHSAIGEQIRANLSWMSETFANPTSPEYRSTGICALHPFRPAPLLNFVTRDPKPQYFSTWNHHVLASVLNECVRAGFVDAIPIRNHLLKVIDGVWKHSLSPYHIGWSNHAFATDNWPDIINTTFAGATPINPPRNTFPPITTPDYIAWARSAVVAAVDANQPWAAAILYWIDTQASKYKGGIPLVWQINPITRGHS